MDTDLKKLIFRTVNDEDFANLALEVFRYQYRNNPLYRSFSDFLHRTPGSVRSVVEIPFLPVEFFRRHRILTGEGHPQTVFESSSTTGSVPGKHFITDLSLYEEAFKKGFTLFYGDPSEWVILALLPSYLERGSSSLVYMADRLIKLTGHPASGFYRNEQALLSDTLRDLRKASRKVLLLGVSYALLDLSGAGPFDLSHVTVMETGGMKGRRREMVREELHSVLKKCFNVPAIHSEYGMTELLSQAYSDGNGLFRTPPWMKIMLRDPQDPLCIENGVLVTGGINIIDLANINSCSFIATGDLGRIHNDGRFEVKGRFDNSDIRGCNLMAG